jgi:hypothetical protein
MKIPKVAALLVFLYVTPLAQQTTFEYGSSEELNGITRIYVYAGTDMSGRENIIKEIKKKVPSIVITDKPEDAEVILEYGSSAERLLSGATSTSDGYGVNTTATYRKVVHGEGIVYKRGATGNMRLLMDFKDTRKSRFERRPSTNFAREFLKAYVKANNKK